MERANYLDVEQYRRLNEACITLQLAYPRDDHYGIYLVGSCTRRPDYRDVDIRMIMPDQRFAAMFRTDEWSMHEILNPALAFHNSAVTLWLRDRTALPIDFQFQQMTMANELYPQRQDHQRHAIGMRAARKLPSSEQPA